MPPRKKNPLPRLDFELQKWARLSVGQIVKVREDEPFPTDLVLLNTSSKKGICYVETKNLDGETNLKHKEALKETVQACHDDISVLSNIPGTTIECEAPNDLLYKFEGNLVLNNKRVALGPDQLLLRGSTLKNTTWIYGIVVFTGHETKIM